MILFVDAGLEFEHEHDLGEPGRIDFYFQRLRLGIEVKTQGSPSSVLEQMIRYANSDRIDELVLISTRGQLVHAMPMRMNDKPVSAFGPVMNSF